MQRSASRLPVLSLSLNLIVKPQNPRPPAKTVTHCVILYLIPIPYLAILSALAMAGGLYFFFLGFRLLARKRLLLSTPTSRIRSAALGLVEVNGMAEGPHTIPAPITGQPCFLYRTTAWRRRKQENEWEQVADETLHAPFFIDDGTGRLLIEPFGADLDLHRAFREEFEQPFLAPGLETLPPTVSAFLARHGIASGHFLRVEERLIKPQDPLFVIATMAENPELENSSVENPAVENETDVSRQRPLPAAMPPEFTAHHETPQVIRLSDGSGPSAPPQSQQAKIAAALVRAGITKPEAWAAAGVSYQKLAAGENTLAVATRSPGRAASPRPASFSKNAAGEGTGESQPGAPGFDLKPPVLLMKGPNNPLFVISYRSQKEFVESLAWKSAALVGGGAALALFGVYLAL